MNADNLKKLLSKGQCFQVTWYKHTNNQVGGVTVRKNHYFVRGQCVFCGEEFQ